MTDLPHRSDIERTATEEHVGKGNQETNLIGCRHPADINPVHIYRHADNRKNPGEDGLTRENGILTFLNLLHRPVFLYHEVVADAVDLLLHRLQRDLLRVVVDKRRTPCETHGSTADTRQRVEFLFNIGRA